MKASKLCCPRKPPWRLKSVHHIPHTLGQGALPSYKCIFKYYIPRQLRGRFRRSGAGVIQRGQDGVLSKYPSISCKFFSHISLLLPYHNTFMFPRLSSIEICNKETRISYTCIPLQSVTLQASQLCKAFISRPFPRLCPSPERTPPRQKIPHLTYSPTTGAKSFLENIFDTQGSA